MPLREALTQHFARVQNSGSHTGPVSKLRKALALALSAVALLGILYAVVRMVVMLAALSQQEIRNILWGTGATFLRVEFTLLLAGLWTVPAGVFIGLRPRLAAFVQPLAQIAASVPAIALFPILVLVLIRAGGGLGVASILLLLLGTQWYILFNVIAGASAIPADLKEVCDIYHLGLVERWRRLILPGIFPYLITGFVTASGGAWNASVVAEYVHFKNQTLSTTGLGALISQATDSGNMRLLLGATVVMSFVVVTVNRLLWRPLYRLAATKYKLEN
jgi:NitT/TauT family transport system permease protein